MNAVRKGARRMSEIPPAILRQLEAGEVETVNLVECLAIDQRKLAKTVLKQTGQQRLVEAVLSAIDRAARPTAMQHITVIGQELGKHLAPDRSPRSAFSKLASHPSDIVRSWAAFATVAGDGPFGDRLEAIRPFAADRHFGVREIAWMALRPHIAWQLTPAVELLAAWSYEADANLRRFASEATRPRGVWCTHLELLKAEPHRGLAILEPLKSDSSKYVRDSVGNWLNDAAKTQPQFVRTLCKQWRKASGTPETAYIVQKAVRSL
jgi:3-methyladenine DNA glycosylase AlkC